ncbi:hypothetical protein [Dyadobacter sp. BHUBP1]|uniref:hypothetical protein n=1 Tax=Dyadobacter sp. BHUBP1 TaxID=3424178 RepID=UPI003D3470F2
MDQSDDYYDKYVESWEQVRGTLRSGYRAYDYNYSPYFSDYNNLYTFIYDNINTAWDNLKIKPVYFFFNDSDELEAVAISRSKAITINKGLLERLMEFFNRYEAYLARPASTQPVVYRHLDMPVHSLMFQSAALFLYYHELGHIIQHLPGTDRSFSESRIGTSDPTFILEDNVMELDADDFAAYNIASHVVDHWSRLPEVARDQQTLEILIGLNIASAFIMFYVLSGERLKPIYFEAYDHPHDTIRVVNIIGKMVEDAKGYRKTKNFTLSSQSILGVALRIVKDTFDETIYNDFRATLNRDQPQIVAHFNMLKNEYKTRSWLAGNRMIASQKSRSPFAKIKQLWMNFITPLFS